MSLELQEKQNSLPMVDITLYSMDEPCCGVTYHFDMQALADAIYQAIPAWVKSSSAPITFREGVPEAEQIDIRYKCEMGRSALKGLVAALGMIPQMSSDLYGPDFELGRADSMPLISRWLVWFMLAQIHGKPLDIIADGTQTVRVIRPSIRTIQSAYAQTEGDTRLQEAES